MFTHYSHHPPTTPPSSSYLDPAIIRPGEPTYEGPEDTDSEKSDTPYRVARRRKSAEGSRRHTTRAIAPMIQSAYPSVASSSALKLDSRTPPSHYLPSSDHLYLTSPVQVQYRDFLASVPVPKPSSPLRYRTDPHEAASGSGEPSTPGLESDRTDSVVLPPRRMMDMNMAVSGSEAAQAGINTPLAAYAAQTVTWLWFGASSAPVDPSSPLLSSPNPFDPHTSSSSPLNPHQVTPSTQFTEFVANMLKITMVSHSVTLIALLYIYRLKQRNPIKAEPGSEQRPFVASLILGNKYLDDNTYTNQTWSELAGLPLAEINRMEAEFLRGLDYKLGVQVEEYNQWKVLLDGFILARQREAAELASYPHIHSSHLSSTRPSVPISPQLIQTPPMPITSGALQPSFYIPTRSRARSTSPQTWSPPTQPAPSFFPPSPTLSRKRSALDAFSSEMTQTGIYESLRHPPRRAGRAAFQNGTLSYGPSPTRQVSGGLGRSSSLNRRIARLPDDRRGSFGHAHSTSAGTIEYNSMEYDQGYASAYASPGPSYAVPSALPLTPSRTQYYAAGHMTAPPSGMATPEADLRHAVTIGQATRNAHAAWHAAQQVPSHLIAPGEVLADDYALEDGWNSLVAPYQRTTQDGVVPPEHLMFYTLAAEAHPGQAGAPRKAILRYQQPLPVPLPPQAQALFHGYTFGQPNASHSQPTSMQVDISGQGYPVPPDMRHYAALGHHHPPAAYGVRPEPAQFANAGPPGYVYDPALHPSHSGLGFGFHPGYEQSVPSLPAYAGDEMQGVEGQWSSRGDWRTRSEWSSPMAGTEWR